MSHLKFTFIYWFAHVDVHILNKIVVIPDSGQLFCSKHFKGSCYIFFHLTHNRNGFIYNINIKEWQTGLIFLSCFSVLPKKKGKEMFIGQVTWYYILLMLPDGILAHTGLHSSVQKGYTTGILLHFLFIIYIKWSQIISNYFKRFWRQHQKLTNAYLSFNPTFPSAATDGIPIAKKQNKVYNKMQYMCSHLKIWVFFNSVRLWYHNK